MGRHVRCESALVAVALRMWRCGSAASVVACARHWGCFGCVGTHLPQVRERPLDVCLDSNDVDLALSDAIQMCTVCAFVSVTMRACVHASPAWMQGLRMRHSAETVPLASRPARLRARAPRITTS